MFTLVALGTGAAWVYSLVRPILRGRSGPRRDDDLATKIPQYCINEHCATLTTFGSIGNNTSMRRGAAIVLVAKSLPHSSSLAEEFNALQVHFMSFVPIPPEPLPKA